MPEYSVHWFLSGVRIGNFPTRIGNAQLALYDLSSSKDAIDWVRKRCDGVFQPEWETKGWPTVLCVVSGEGPQDALRATYDLAVSVADMMSLWLTPVVVTLSMGPDATAHVFGAAAVTEGGGGYAIFYEYTREIPFSLNADGSEDQKIDTINSQIILPLLSNLPDNLTGGSGDELCTRIKRGLHWWGQARRTRLMVAKFVLGWIALESLVATPEDPERGKSGRIKKRLRLLSRAHGHSYAHQDFDAIWSLRSELIHEASRGYFDVAAGHGRQIMGHVDMIGYLMTIAAIFLMEKAETCSTLDEAWSGITSYRPKQPLRFDDFPFRLMVVDYCFGPDNAKATRLFDENR
jgi:hypothetical protein